MESQNQTKTWYATLMADCNSLGEKFGLDDMMNGELRDFVVRIAKEQYKVGNKSGIRWLRMELAKQGQTSTQPAGA